ncbi:MAG TPA: hypothetical protein VMV17_10890 [Streptosporangiaceae bacterium]|nr:hypothetical protein [Streptosporangiaceae bacterium]
MSPAQHAGPFSALGLPARPGITDDEVRAAWRRVAAATHPDRADGGDPARFAAAAAAYTALRTRYGRGEALAGPGQPAVPAPARRGWVNASPARLLARARHGRPARLALRLAAVAAVSAAALLVAAGAPATPALIIGAFTWLMLTAGQDLAPPS